MRVALTEDVVVGQLQAPADPPANMGARIEVPYTRAIVSYWRPAELDPETHVWTCELERPINAGDYLLVFRTGDPEPPEMEVFFPLFVG